MIRTILLYDGKNTSAERIASSLSCLVGFASVADINEPVADLGGYTGCCLIFNYYGVVTSGNIIRFLANNSTTLQKRRVAVVGIGFSDRGFMKFIADLGNKTGVRHIEGFFISHEDQVPSIGTEIGKMMRAPLKPMPEEMLSARIADFIGSHNTLALATMAKGYIRCTPLEYLYLDGVFYIITEGGNKFRGILDNGQVSAAIFDPFDPQGATKGLQITGEARIIPAGSDEYLKVLHARGVTDKQLRMLPVTLFLVKIIPFNYEILDSTFSKDGYDSRQFMNTKYRQEVYEEGQRWLHPEQAAEPMAKVQSETDGTVSAADETGKLKNAQTPDLNEGVVEFQDNTAEEKHTPEDGKADSGERTENTTSEEPDEAAGEKRQPDMSDREMADTLLDGAGLSDAEINSFSLSDSKKAAKFKDALRRVKRFPKRSDDENKKA